MSGHSLQNTSAAAETVVLPELDLGQQAAPPVRLEHDTTSKAAHSGPGRIRSTIFGVHLTAGAPHGRRGTALSWKTDGNCSVAGTRIGRRFKIRDVSPSVQPGTLVQSSSQSSAARFAPDGLCALRTADLWSGRHHKRGTGAKINAEGIDRDPVLSGHGHFVKASGLSLISPFPGLIGSGRVHS